MSKEETGTDKIFESLFILAFSYFGPWKYSLGCDGDTNQQARIGWG